MRKIEEQLSSAHYAGHPNGVLTRRTIMNKVAGSYPGHVLKNLPHTHTFVFYRFFLVLVIGATENTLLNSL